MTNKYKNNIESEAKGINPTLCSSKEKLEEVLQKYRFTTYDDRYDITRNVRAKARSMFKKYQEDLAFTKQIKQKESVRKNAFLKKHSKEEVFLLINKLLEEKISGRKYSAMRTKINHQIKNIISFLPTELSNKYQSYFSIYL